MRTGWRRLWHSSLWDYRSATIHFRSGLPPARGAVEGAFQRGSSRGGDSHTHVGLSGGCRQQRLGYDLGGREATQCHVSTDMAQNPCIDLEDVEVLIECRSTDGRPNIGESGHVEGGDSGGFK